MEKTLATVEHTWMAWKEAAEVQAEPVEPAADSVEETHPDHPWKYLENLGKCQASQLVAEKALVLPVDNPMDHPADHHPQMAEMVTSMSRRQVADVLCHSNRQPKKEACQRNWSPQKMNKCTKGQKQRYENRRESLVENARQP